jgi:hypothetical protein
MKLKVGDKILIHGFVMLKGLEDGQKYRVQSTPPYYNNPTYQFTKGKKVVCRHDAYSIDAWITADNLNRIEII